jgi:nicotinate phosphoribosyltransferase
VGTDGDTLTIRASGPQVHVMGFEIYVLYIVNELYFRRFDQSAALAEGRARLQAKVAALKAFGRAGAPPSFRIFRLRHAPALFRRLA